MNIMALFGRKSANTEISPSFTLYEREERPSALQGWLFSDDAVATIGLTLLSSGLSWVWESTRTGPPVVTVDEDLFPEHRPRQLLSKGVLSLLESDLLERNLHGFRRFVALYGGTGDLIDKFSNDDELRDEIEAFVQGKPSSVSTLLVQLGDVAADVIYFSRHNITFVDPLLEALGHPPLNDVFTTAYREMKGEDLETVIEYLSCAEHDH
jgi:hypothetical protein